MRATKYISTAAAMFPFLVNIAQAEMVPLDPRNRPQDAIYQLVHQDKVHGTKCHGPDEQRYCSLRIEEKSDEFEEEFTPLGGTTITTIVTTRRGGTRALYVARDADFEAFRVVVHSTENDAFPVRELPYALCSEPDDWDAFVKNPFSIDITGSGENVLEGIAKDHPDKVKAMVHSGLWSLALQLMEGPSKYLKFQGS